jgi:hypothetical protein
MALPPNKDEVEAAKASLVENGVQDIDAAMMIAVADFDGGEWSQETVAGYAYKLKAKHPELWTSPPTAADAANAALERQAFEGKGNASARAKLVRSIGQEAADAAAVRYGLRGVGDFASKGTAPAVTDDKGGDDKSKDDKSTNPWRLPPGPEGDAKRAAAIRSLGPRVCAGLAKACSVDLAGRPLRTA